MIDMGYARDVILKAMIDNKVSQVELANNSGISKSTINGFLTGARNNISFDSLIHITNYLKIPIEVLLGSELRLEHEAQLICNMLKVFPEDERNVVLNMIKNNISSLYKLRKTIVKSPERNAGRYKNEA